MQEKPAIAAPVKPKRCWFSFSLRALLIFVMVVGCGFAWLGWKVQEAREQAAAVAAIKKLGGIVEYDHEIDSQGNRLLDTEPSNTLRLRTILGDDFFYNVVSVNFTVNSLTDPGLEYFMGPEVSDTDLEHLKGFSALNVLVLDGTKVTDFGMQKLKGLPKLKRLGLSLTRITDVGLDNLKGLTQLQTLDLDNTQVTDAGLANLKGLAQLTRLYVRNTRVTDAGVGRLQEALPNCLILREFDGTVGPPPNAAKPNSRRRWYRSGSTPRRLIKSRNGREARNR